MTKKLAFSYAFQIFSFILFLKAGEFMIEVFKNDISCVTLMNINLLETAVTSVPNIPLEKSYAWWVKDNTISGSYFQTAVSPIFTYANFAKTAELGIRPLLHLHSYSKEKFKNIKPGEKAFISRISDEFHPLFFYRHKRSYVILRRYYCRRQIFKFR